MEGQAHMFFDLAELSHVGQRVIIGKTVRIRKPDRVRIGDHSIIDDFTYISCGLTVGRYTHIGSNSTLIGGNAHVAVGDFVNIAPGCRLIAATNDPAGGGLAGPAIPEAYAAPSIEADIQIEDHALFGTSTVVLPGTHVPEGVATGAFTLLTPKLKLKPWTVYVGIPGKALRQRDGKHILKTARDLLSSQGLEG